MDTKNENCGLPSEAEKLTIFGRADICVQNFPDDKKVCKFQFCGQNSG